MKDYLGFEALVKASERIKSGHRFQGPREGITAIGLSRNGSLAASFVGGQLRIWNIRSKQELFRDDRTARFAWITFSPDDRFFSFERDDYGVDICDCETFKCVRHFNLEGSSFESLTYSFNGKWLATSVNGGIKTVEAYQYYVSLLEIETGQELRKFSDEGNSFASVQFAPNDHILAVSSDTGRISFWDPKSGRLVRSLEGHSGAVKSISFCPDGQWLVSGGVDKTIRIWDVQTGIEHRRIATDSQIFALCFSPDGRVLASGSADGRVRLWHVQSGGCIWQSAPFRAWRPGFALKFSPDGAFLAHDENTADGDFISLLDVSTLDLGPDLAPKDLYRLSARGEQAIQAHVRVLPLSHEVSSASNLPASSWLRHSSSLRGEAPIFLIRDLGAALCWPREALQFKRASYLPADLQTDFYLNFLQKLSTQSLARQISTWRMNEACAGVILARLLSGCSFPDEFNLPEGLERVTCARALAEKLRDADPSRIWGETPPAERPSFSSLVTPELLVRIETNFKALNIEELRLIHQYGPAMAGSPDPRDLLDLFNLLGLPSDIRNALSQMLRLIPRISRKVGGDHAQMYALGGYAGLSRNGNLDSLLPTELARPELSLWSRLLNKEALYYAWESEKEKRRELALIVTQMGAEMQGDIDVLARALTLALAKILGSRGFPVRQSFVGSVCTEPVAMDQPSSLHQLLYYRDNSRLRAADALEKTLQRLRAWGEEFRHIQVYWVLSEHWDMDDWEQNRPLYEALRQKARQEAWFLCSPVADGGVSKRPPSAALFDRYDIIRAETLLGQPRAARDKGTALQTSWP